MVCPEESGGHRSIPVTAKYLRIVTCLSVYASEHVLEISWVHLRSPMQARAVTWNVPSYAFDTYPAPNREL